MIWIQAYDPDPMRIARICIKFTCVSGEDPLKFDDDPDYDPTPGSVLRSLILAEV